MSDTNTLKVQNDVAAVEAGFKKLLIVVRISSVVAFAVYYLSGSVLGALFRRVAGVDIDFASYIAGGVTTAVALLLAGVPYLLICNKIEHARNLAVESISSFSD